MESRKQKNPSSFVSRGRPSERRGIDTASLRSGHAKPLHAKGVSFKFDSKGKETHAVVPISEYAYMVALKQSQDALPIVETRNSDSVDFEDFLGQVAGPKIAAARNPKGWTQAELGRKSDMPQSQISRLERHPAKLTYRTLERIAAALGVEVGTLL